jgi:tRNA A-37 threonylcarbamoyl transferase component Bud32
MAESLAHGPTQAATEPRQTGEVGEVERLAPGTVIAEYAIEKFLGAGAMGAVYEGRHPLIGKRVAIKVLRRELASTAEGAERFVREARAVNQIDHPNVIDVFGFGQLDDGRLYLVMDLVDGRSLRKLVQDGPLPVASALDILGAVGEALDAAHARGVVHRDLKPDNVMISSGSPPKVFVLDFGIAKLVVDRGGVAATLTGQGTWLGTPGYMAPEQWSADGAGPASDRYALGVMAYELLSGKLPFQAPTLPQMMEQHFRAPVPALSSASGTLVERTAFDPVLAHAMAKDPDKRFSTARELVAALRDAAAGKRAATARGKKLWLPAAAGVAVLGVTVGGVVLMRDDGSKPAAQREVTPKTLEREPAAGFVKIVIDTRPAGAKVMRTDDGPERLLQGTPATLELRVGKPMAIAIRKPGYLTVRRELTPSVNDKIDVELQPLNAFDGVWVMPDGQLRELARNGDQVDVFKRASLTGARDLWRKFEFAEMTRDDEVTFATRAEMSAEGGNPDPSCRLTHKIEYHYHLANKTLDVQAERIGTGKRPDGGCFVKTSEPGLRRRLVRAEETSDTTWTEPPVGRPAEPRPSKKPPDKTDFGKPAQKKPPPKKPPVKGNAKTSVGNDVGDIPQQQQQLQQQQTDEPPPPRLEQNSEPRGDSQVAPPVQRKGQ